jgi:hypothetical protein
MTAFVVLSVIAVAVLSVAWVLFGWLSGMAD